MLNAGIGNTVMTVPVLCALAARRPDWHQVLLGTRPGEAVDAMLPPQVSPAPVDTPALWRRFRESDWSAIFEFLGDRDIDLVINLRKEALGDEVGYPAFREAAAARGIECWDLHELSTPEIDGVAFAEQACTLLRRHGIDVKPEPAPYLGAMRQQPEAPTVGLFLGASRAVKRWQAHSWQALIQRLREECPQVRIEITGGGSPAELRLLAETLRDVGQCDFTAVELDDFPAVMRWIGSLSVLVAGDTAAMHVAFAQGVPAVGLYFSTLASVWGPPGEPGRTAHVQSQIGVRCKAMRINGICRQMDLSCPAPCRRGVRPADVARTVLDLLPAAAVRNEMRS